MADAEEIARDIVVALLADNITDLGQLVPDADPTRVGEALGELYLGVLEKVRRGPEADDPPLGGSPMVPAVDAGRVRDNQSIPDDAETPVRYNSNLYDTAGIHPETFDGESRFTAPVDGLYLIRASVRWAAGGPGTRELILRRNGGGNHATHRFDPDDLGLPRMHSIERTQLLKAGDFVEAVVKQTTGDALEVALGVDTEFQMHWLAPAPPE